MTLVRVLSVNRTTTATYVASKLLGAIGLILQELGLGALYKNYSQWAFIETSFQTWMEEGTLESATLEVFDPASDEALTVCKFPISYYDPKADERTFQQDFAIAQYQARKARLAMRSNTDFRVLVYRKPWAKVISGWSTTRARSTDGMTKLSAGSVASGPHASASLEIWIRR